MVVDAAVSLRIPELVAFASYDKFQWFCATKCERNAKCVVANVQICPRPPGSGLNPAYSCILNADVKVHGVKAAQLSLKNFTSNIVYVKKGRVVPSIEPCKVDPLELERSFGCAQCLQATPPANWTDCDNTFGTDCSSLLSKDSNLDFTTRVAPGAGCLDQEGGNVTACLKCTKEKLLTTPSISLVAGTICTEDDDLNLVRGLCKEECYSGNSVACEGLIQQSALCITGSPLIRNQDSFAYGRINTPYECPSTV